jgi:hypothetical protein
LFAEEVGNGVVPAPEFALATPISMLHAVSLRQEVLDGLGYLGKLSLSSVVLLTQVF